MSEEKEADAPAPCSGCGKPTNYYGQKWMLSASSAVTEDERRRMQESLGPYEIGKAYYSCWECTLKALGVKPPTEKET